MGNERGHSGFPESVGSHVVSEMQNIPVSRSSFLPPLSGGASSLSLRSAIRSGAHHGDGAAGGEGDDVLTRN